MAELLYKVGTATSFDLRQLIFNQIISQAEPIAIRPALPLPSLIYGLVTKQRNIRRTGEVLLKEKEFIRINKKFYIGSHVNDLEEIHQEDSASTAPEPVADN